MAVATRPTFTSFLPAVPRAMGRRAGVAVYRARCQMRVSARAVSHSRRSGGVTTWPVAGSPPLAAVWSRIPPGYPHRLSFLTVS